MAGLFQVLWGQSDGSFKKAEALQGTDGEPLTIPYDGRQEILEGICTRPTAADWDGDGDLDLVVGNFAGGFYLFIGEGQGRFHPEPEALQTGEGQRLKIKGRHSDPFIVDWDGDGDLDLLSGSSAGGVSWAENTAGAGEHPELKQFETLIEAGPSIARNQPLAEGDLQGPAQSTRVWADDVDNDGKLDLLVGDNVTLVSPAKGLTAEEMSDKLDEWNQAIRKISGKMRDKDVSQEERSEARTEFRDLYARRSEFINEQRTGFVWLYRRK